ncbi:OstA-like protein [Lutibacter sp.]|uniref:OstA-like protein n=1 Tax=Lutibacter sp. TaxID=1925666 RepID=UPI002734EA6F|nr:OstA-like protein [Lutibacter sp.]MDP3312651.1 OstA-like protein [Lutibacter sp.]
MMQQTFKKILFITIVLTCFNGIAQTKKINILQADNTYVDPKFPGATISIGNVFVEHDGATLRCDKAYIYQELKLVKALGNVILNQGDTVIQYSKYSDYNGFTKIATSWGNVVLKDEIMELKTDTLRFDRENQHLFYKSGGTIKDTTNVLKSKIGNYYLREDKFQAFTNVDVSNKSSKLISNHLDYYTNTGIAELFGPSTITNAKNSIYTEKGKHNTKTNISHFLKNSKIYYDDRTISGDSLFYNRNKDFATATGNIKVIDTVNKTTIKGGYAEYYKLKDSIFIINRAVAISQVENDSIYIHGDKLLITGKVEDRTFKAFKNVKYFKSDLQGKCDSLVSFEKIGLTKFIKDPIMWAQGNQITGDVIHLISNTQKETLDSLKILNNAFMIQKDSAGFSQLKGKNMFGKFEDNKLISLHVVSNSEVLFYIRDEVQNLIGISQMRSSNNIFIRFENNEISTIDYNKKPEGKTYPPSKIKENDKLLKGFIWRESERPINKDAIFIHDKVVIDPKEKTPVNIKN